MDPDIEPWHLPHMDNQPNDAMKPSHLITPRQLADCTFTVGHPERVRRTGRSADWAIAVLFGAFCVLAIAGVF
jgi:hypothetical protein